MGTRHQARGPCFRSDGFLVVVGPGTPSMRTKPTPAMGLRFVRIVHAPMKGGGEGSNNQSLGAAVSLKDGAVYL